MIIGKGTDTKSFYQAFRLLQEAKRMTEGKDPKVWIEGEERDYLMSIRNNEKNPNDLLVELDKLHQIVEQQKLSLPNETDTRPLNDWLVNVRLNDIRKILQQDEKGIEQLLTPVENTNTEIGNKAEMLLAKFGIK